MPKLRFPLFAVAAVLVLAASTFAAAGAEKACGPYCDHSWGGTTPTATAIGTSCSVAQTNLNSQLKSFANSFCGTGGCQLVVTTTVACNWTGSGYSVSGYATFGCRDSTC
jgi:hypothetical protein